MNIFSSSNILSMEFTDNNIRIVTGRFHKNELRIDKYFTIDIPDNMYKNGDILDFSQLSYIIKRNLEINKIKIKNTHILLDTDKIIIREIVIPTVKENNYEEFLAYHLEDYLPIDKDKYIIKHIVIDSVLSENNTRLQVTAAPRTLISNFHKLISHLDLKPLVFDIVGNCISKFLFHNYEFGMVATIGIDNFTTNIIVSNFGQLRYSKTLDIGYNKVFKYIKDIDISEYDLIDILSKENLDNESEEIKRIRSANLNFQEELLHEIDVILKFYLKDENIETIYLYEEYSKICNIQDVFANHYECHCHRLNILDKFRFNGDILNYANSVSGIIRL